MYKIRKFLVFFAQFELFAILAAAKSNYDEQTSEESWYSTLKKTSVAVLSPSELQASQNLNRKDRFHLFKFLVHSRIQNAEDAQHILVILAELEDGLDSLEGWFGRLTFELFSNSEYKNGQVSYCYYI